MHNDECFGPMNVRYSKSWPTAERIASTGLKRPRTFASNITSAGSVSRKSMGCGVVTLAPRACSISTARLIRRLASRSPLLSPHDESEIVLGVLDLQYF